FDELKNNPSFYEVVNTLKICNQNLCKNKDFPSEISLFFAKHGYFDESSLTSITTRQQGLNASVARKRRRSERNEDNLNQSFLFAAENGNIDALKSLTGVVNIDKIKKAKVSPLHLAALNGHVEIIEYLVQELDFDVSAKGCCFDVFNANVNWPPLMWATYNDHGAAVEKLIELGADINYVWKTEDDSLEEDEGDPWVNTDEATLFSSKVSPFDLPFEEYNFSPLFIALKLGFAKTVLVLLNSKVNLTKDDFITAVNYCSKDVVKAFFQHGADESFANYCFTNIFTEDKYRPLHIACERGDIEMVKLLIQYKADLDAIATDFDHGDRLPIMIAVHEEYYEIFDVLVAKGADINAKNEEGISILNWVADIIASRSYCNEDLSDIEKRKSSHIKAIKCLVRNKADVNTVDDLGETPLLKLFKVSDSNERYYSYVREAANVLIDNGADINVQGENDKTILMLLVEEYIRFVLSRPPDPKTLEQIQSFIKFWIDSNALIDTRDNEKLNVFDKLTEALKRIEGESKDNSLDQSQIAKNFRGLKEMSEYLQKSYEIQISKLSNDAFLESIDNGTEK
ncbi:MAG: hypothetical protein K1060chlam4_00165, partial [Candidatus Anoxychlamydiales bacterium]|nr:hypothetical protein [Candidatus Anoxychlamydiales bacterium]